MPFKKGQSGNPAGRASTKAWADALRLAINETDGKHKKLRKVAEKVVEMALDGDMQAIREIGDRLDGKPAQALEHSGSFTVSIEGKDADCG